MGDNRYLEALRRQFRDTPQRVFCRQIAPDGRETLLTWADLEQASAVMTTALEASTARPSGEVMIFLRHRPELYGAFFGAMLGGWAPAFMPCPSAKQDPQLYWSAHAELFRRIRPAAVITDGETLAGMRAAGLDFCGAALIDVDQSAPAVGAATAPRSDRAGGDIAFVQHSSGTTGLKKGVALSFDAVTAQIDAYAASLRIGPQDVIVSWLPLYHDMGLIACLILPAMLGVEIVHLDPFAWVAEPQSLFEQIERRGGTLCWMPNFAFEHLAAIVPSQGRRYDLSSIRAFIDCSEMCRPDSFTRFLAAFEADGVRLEALQCCYAMAETVFAVTQTPLDRPPRRLQAASASLQQGMAVREAVEDEPSTMLLEVGEPLSGMIVRIIDADRRPLPAGMVGEIEVSAPYLFDGYQGEPERTAAALKDGAYATSDLGFLLEDRLFVLGRKDDLIVVNGRNLYAHQMEAELSRIGGVKPGRVVAVGVTDERIGSQGLVVIAERAEVSQVPDRDVRRAIAETLNTLFAIAPRQVRLVEAGWLVKTTSGKISRKENLARLLNAPPSGGPPPPVA
ncbi:hypothetical protein BH09PSE2_BH09PSE2_02240 [soil metagenome]